MEDKNMGDLNSNRMIYQVSELTGEVRLLLESSYPSIWVEGEISNLAQPRSGHLYFSLKDARSQVRCAFFKNRMSRLMCNPADGLKVRVRAQVSLYPDRGDFQLIISQMEEAGQGDLQAAFEKLKQKLATEGLFAAEHKKSLPKFPRTIAIITSATGAAIKDIITTCERRYPIVQLKVFPVRVQGEGAAVEITHALKKADQSGCDVLILGRGGGSLEDLQAFNEEVLARAVYACITPVISAVGHDIYFSISDFVADIRASTPTAAAEISTPDARQLDSQFEQFQQRLNGIIRNSLIYRIQRTDLLSNRLVHPSHKLSGWLQKNAHLSDRIRSTMDNCLVNYQHKLDNLTRSLHVNSPKRKLEQKVISVNTSERHLLASIKQYLKQQRSKFQSANGKLVAISPQSTLDRGYAIVNQLPDNSILKSVNKVRSNSSISVRLADGSFRAKTEDLADKKPDQSVLI